MLYPARLGVNLAYFPVGAGDNLSGLIDKESSTARGSLVYD
jgi:hypothetical protein